MDLPLDRLLNSLDLAVLCVDDCSTLLLLNEAAAKMLGCECAQVAGQPLRRFPALMVIVDRLLLGELSDAGAGSKAVRRWQVERPGGQTASMEATVSCLPLEGRKAYTAVIRDVSLQEQMEKAVYESRKTQALGALAGGIAHDFNNILTAVISQIDLVLHAPEFPSTLKDHLVFAQTSARRGAELISKLESFSRQGKTEFTPLALAEILDQVAFLLRHSIDPKVTIQCPKPAADAWPARADRNQILQAVLNLCIHARDAMPQGGRLTLALKNVSLGVADARPPRRVGDFVQLTVADTGHGMTPEVLSRIFEPYFTTKGASRGAGLGLSIASALVAEHSGWIEVESQVGQGTQFSVFLPRATATASVPEPIPQSAHKATDGHERILVVDDEELVRMVTKAVLAYRGYEVVEAEDGEDAVAKYAAAPTSFDLVLMDMHMPRLNGHDALLRIRQLNPAAKAIMLSGGLPDAEGGIGQMEKVAFLHKPFENQELVRLVRELLDSA